MPKKLNFITSGVVLEERDFWLFLLEWMTFSLVKKAIKSRETIDIPGEKGAILSLCLLCVPKKTTSNSNSDERGAACEMWEEISANIC